MQRSKLQITSLSAPVIFAYDKSDIRQSFAERGEITISLESGFVRSGTLPPSKLDFFPNLLQLGEPNRCVTWRGDTNSPGCGL